MESRCDHFGERWSKYFSSPGKLTMSQITSTTYCDSDVRWRRITQYADRKWYSDEKAAQAPNHLVIIRNGPKGRLYISEDKIGEAEGGVVMLLILAKE